MPILKPYPHFYDKFDESSGRADHVELVCIACFVFCWRLVLIRKPQMQKVAGFAQGTTYHISYWTA